MALNLIPQGKKAMFFTILAIALLSLFIISYSTYSVFQDRESTTKRIKTMNDFIHLVEEDLPRQLYIAGFRIIFIFEKRIFETGNYIEDLNSTFEEAFFNGTVYSLDEELMEGVDFEGIVLSLNEKAKKINANVTLLNPKIEITQEDPWNVKISFTGDLMIQDKGQLVLWNRTYYDKTFISIENFEDPIYAINSGGLVTNSINRTPYQTFVTGSDVSNLISHLEGGYYKASSSAPSFLDRLEGKTTSNPYGIESLVYIPKLSSQGITPKDKTDVDYIYFSTSNPTSHKIQGMPSWFKLDDEHLDDYGVEGLVI